MTFAFLRHVSAFSFYRRPIPALLNGFVVSEDSRARWSNCQSTFGCRMASTETQVDFELKGIEWLQDNVVSVLNELYDPAEVARGNVLAKFSKGKKKKKAKNGDAPIEPEMTESEKQALSDEAAAQAKPFTRKDAMVTPATRPDFGDYQVNAAMGLANALGISPVACANQIVDGLKPRIGSSWTNQRLQGLVLLT
ncbi:hypothetical protein ACA910_012172 [Epithemia clementina (nom. ined.)]